KRDVSSDVCSSDLPVHAPPQAGRRQTACNGCTHARPATSQRPFARTQNTHLRQTPDARYCRTPTPAKPTEANPCSEAAPGQLAPNDTEPESLQPGRSTNLNTGRGRHQPKNPWRLTPEVTGAKTA